MANHQKRLISNKQSNIPNASGKKKKSPSLKVLMVVYAAKLFIIDSKFRKITI